VGMTAVSIAAYELVEEPARKLVLRAAGLLRRSEPAAFGRSARAVAAVVLAVAFIGFAVGIVNRSLARRFGPITLTEVQAARPDPADVMSVPATELRPTGPRLFAVHVPRRWRDGWRQDDRVPSALRVFRDGAPLPFYSGEAPDTAEAAFFQGLRVGSLTIRLQTPGRELTIVNEALGAEARIWWTRLRRASAHDEGTVTR
jgi:hypothetical protein